MSVVKRILLKAPGIRSLHAKGYLNKQERRNLMLYYFFRFFFGLNRESKVPLHYTSNVIAAHKLRIGKNVHRSLLVSGNCYYQAINGIEIGDDTIIAPGVKIISANHDLGRHDMHIEAPPLVIGSNCWIGANAVILPGVRLGNHVVVAAGAVVTKSCLLDHSVLAGVPAKIMTGKT